jgi:hypothetical protein
VRHRRDRPVVVVAVVTRSRWTQPILGMNLITYLVEAGLLTPVQGMLTSEVTIHCKAGEIATLEVVLYPTAEQLAALARAIETLEKPEDVEP